VIACSTGTRRHLARRAAGGTGLGAGGRNPGRAFGRGPWRMIAYMPAVVLRPSVWPCLVPTAECAVNKAEVVVTLQVSRRQIRLLHSPATSGLTAAGCSLPLHIQPVRMPSVLPMIPDLLLGQTSNTSPMAHAWPTSCVGLHESNTVGNLRDHRLSTDQPTRSLWHAHVGRLLPPNVEQDSTPDGFIRLLLQGQACRASAVALGRLPSSTAVRGGQSLPSHGHH
jgi:hypothetical protein